MSELSRRAVLGAAATLPIAAPALAQTRARGRRFDPTWESLLAHYRAPDWFRDELVGSKAPLKFTRTSGALTVPDSRPASAGPVLKIRGTNLV